jgi:hypothetical protein
MHPVAAVKRDVIHMKRGLHGGSDPFEPLQDSLLAIHFDFRHLACELLSSCEH